MKGGVIFLLIPLLIGGLGSVYAQDTVTGAAEAPLSLKNNQYFLESLRLTDLAKESYEEGDYDASTYYAEEALRYARLSDEYVALRMKIWEADRAIAAAGSRLEWAVSMGAPRHYPKEYDQAGVDYAAARTARGVEDWDEAILAANRVLIALAALEAAPGGSVLPAQYTVRPWNISYDCLWNIAAQPWAYGDSSKWPVLYEANKNKLPDLTNPDIVEPGTVLDIPSIRGEARQGMWDPGRTYIPLR